MNEKCPKCGKMTVEPVRNYLDGDRVYVHAVHELREPFPHRLVTKQCLVRLVDEGKIDK
jgi:hypothetical protein